MRLNVEEDWVELEEGNPLTTVELNAKEESVIRVAILSAAQRATGTTKGNDKGIVIKS